MRFKNILAILVAVMFVATAAFAQEAAPKASVDGQLFLWWAQDLTEDSAGTDQFLVKRVYLNYRNKIDDVWSVRVTTDALDRPETVGLKRGGYIFMKYAYVQSKLNFGPASLKVQYGLVGTPIDGLVYKVRGDRWLNTNLIDSYGSFSANGAIDNSADTGIKAALNIMKLVTITGMYSNGEGYSAPNGGADIDKAYYGMLTVTPIKGVYVSGYYKYADDGAPADKNYNQYWGALAAYSTKLYKAGVQYINAMEENAGVEKESSGWDFFLNVNLKDLAGFPILVYASYAMVNSDNGVAEFDQTWTRLGLGYAFNSKIRTMVTYEVDDNDELKAGKGLYIKTEAKF